MKSIKFQKLCGCYISRPGKHFPFKDHQQKGLRKTNITSHGVLVM